MKNFFLLKAVLLMLPIFLGGCTKSKNSEKQIIVYSKEYADPKKKIAEITLNINDRLKMKINETNLLIWSIQDKAGKILAFAIEEDLFFPHKIVILSSHLLAPVKEGALMIFSARIIKKGEEYLAPQKNQPAISYGYFNEESDAKNSLQNFDEVKYKKIVKKLKIQEAQKFIVGDRVTAEFK